MLLRDSKEISKTATALVIPVFRKFRIVYFNRFTDNQVTYQYQKWPTQQM